MYFFNISKGRGKVHIVITIIRFHSSKKELENFLNKKYENSSELSEKIEYNNIKFVLNRFYEDIDFSKKEFKVENLLISAVTNSQIERDFFILTNVTKVLVSICNDFKYYSTMVSENRYEGNVIIGVSTIPFSVSAPKELVELFTKRRGYDNFITIDYINVAIKLVSIHRIKFLNIVYKAGPNKVLKKTDCDSIKNTEGNINYTKGNSIVISLENYSSLVELSYDKKLPTMEKKPVFLLKEGDVTAFEFLNNESYSNNMWIRNKKNIINFDDPSFLFLKAIKVNHKFFLKIINLLRSTRVYIDYDMFDYVSERLEQSKIYKLIVCNLNYEFIKKNIKTIDGAYQYFCTYALIKKRIMLMRSKSIKFFYNSYMFDSRYRIYVSQWPINYQLNHFVRSFVAFEGDEIKNYVETYKKFFVYLEKNGFLSKFVWSYEIFIKEDFFINFITKTNFKININILKHKDYSSDDYIINSIMLEMLVIKLISLAPSNIIQHFDKLKYSVENFTEENTNATILSESIFDNDIKNKDAINIVLERVNLIKILDNNTETVHWVDASSNALQLIVLCRGTNNETLLKLLNLIPNDTGYRNVYFYIHDIIVKVHKNKSLKEWDYLLKFLTAKNIKEIVMPLAYGKTLWSTTSTILKVLEDSEELASSSFWKNLTTTNKKDFVKELYKIVINELRKIDFDIEDHIKMCDENFEINKYFSHLNAPIIAPIYEKDNRSDIIKQIKDLKNIKNILNRDFLNYDGDISGFKYKGLLKGHNVWGENLSETIYKLELKLVSLNNKLKLSDKKSKKIKITVDGKSYQIRFSSPNLLKFKNYKKLAVSPNFTHAYDACLLMKSVEDLYSIGVETFCIHDSIGTKSIFSRIAISVYKINLIMSVNENINKGYFPYKKGINFPVNVQDGIWESDSLFF